MLHQNNTTKTMKTIYAYFLCILGVVSISIYSCDDNNEPTGDDIAINWDTVSTVNPAYQLEQPSNLPPIPVSDSNPLTTEGVELGRRLFYDPILSANNTQSCASCHAQQFGFTDNLRQSIRPSQDRLDTTNPPAACGMWRRHFPPRCLRR